ncbi:MAG: phosphoglycerate dehydrogenase [Rickettsiales bacterium]|nr:phosphoglycerate dehydrogenase [Pseudomonadota bacterium]MDA0965475.1 phosphoglycerate dehydrogenase [Pseudomonadota bacterium]MDG4542799.1 phosphoglycerate dehydrogenase [Rickettsiales bacterium]MDG4544753.1 phosphoglycerate dehydrogenase [Rickettsiales bacterium]MDG4546875.1 phosphoglycerate dehydrogenase [Rickettsiales bacterium]
MPKVLISDKMSPKAAEIFKNNKIEVDVKTGLSEDELCKIIGDYDGLAIRSSTTATEKVIKAAKNLKVIGRAGIGVDNVDQKAATANGVVVMNTPFGNSITTAEHAIAMMMSLARQIPVANESTHAGKWEKSRFMGVEVASKTLGLIGCGNIGSIVADRAQGLKMKVIGFDPYLSPERAKELNIEKVELDELLKRSDFISLHTPLNDSTRGILGKENLAQTKKGVYIINCARGGLIVEKDLKDAIESGHVAGAALDVFEEEPAKENVLFGMEQIICTPHLGASTSEAQENVAIQVAEQLSDYLNNGTVTNALNITSVSSEDAAKLKPYLQLGEQLGSFSGQLLQSGIKKVEIEFEGAVAKMNVKPITSVILTGLLKPVSESVNMVNAPIVAKDRGISVSEVKHERESDYQNLIKVTVTTEKGNQYVAGTLFGGTKPRIVEVGQVKLEASLGSKMLYINNEDKPGLIGDLGKLLGDSNINIANFHLGRGANEKSAIALVEIDEEPKGDLLEKISKLNSVINAKLLSF